MIELHFDRILSAGRTVQSFVCLCDCVRVTFGAHEAGRQPLRGHGLVKIAALSEFQHLSLFVVEVTACRVSYPTSRRDDREYLDGFDGSRRGIARVP